VEAGKGLEFGYGEELDVQFQLGDKQQVSALLVFYETTD
jgi:hypothetical protein